MRFPPLTRERLTTTFDDLHVARSIAFGRLFKNKKFMTLYLCLLNILYAIGITQHTL